MDAERLRDCLVGVLPFPQVIAEDGGWSVFLPGVPAATFDEAMIVALREYADDWQESSWTRRITGATGRWSRWSSSMTTRSCASGRWAWPNEPADADTPESSEFCEVRSQPKQQEPSMTSELPAVSTPMPLDGYKAATRWAQLATFDPNDPAVERGEVAAANGLALLQAAGEPGVATRHSSG